MLTRLRVKNFKRFPEIDIELGKMVVLIGPNNSGKTTALQALALWNTGVRRWTEKRSGKASPQRRPGVTLNRRDLLSIPVPSANLLWRDLHVRNVERAEKPDGKIGPKTENIRIDVIVDGVTEGKSWTCGLEFDYANVESLYCRPLRFEVGSEGARMDVPVEAGKIQVSFLPPMSGLAAVEPKWEVGRINVLIGEGQTAQVVRNLCYRILDATDGKDSWEALGHDLHRLFGVKLLPPAFLAERGEITMEYEERNGTRLDLSSSGRGLQQTLLLLAHLYANPGSVLLLDEPDAHLEILRQRQIYQLLTETAEKQASQIIAASHSEVVLNEASNRDVVIAFVGTPHRIGARSSQVLKSLTTLGFDQYYLAEQTGWVLYVEDSTDLAILRAFARIIDHPAQSCLERPFVHYVATNLPQVARNHFFGLQAAKSDLVGIALFDRLDKELQEQAPLVELMWSRREIENYFCSQEVLLEYARYDLADDLFGSAERERRTAAMNEAIASVTTALATLGRPSPWSTEIKASDEFLDPVFKNYFGQLGLPVLLRKSEYHFLTKFLPKNMIDPEVSRKLDAIHAVAKQAHPTAGQ